MVTEKRRRFPRIAFRTLVGVLCKGRYQVVSAFELGEGGISFFSQSPIQIGEQVLVTLGGFKQKFYCLRCEVRNFIPQAERGYSVGVQFINTPFEIRREIRNYVATQGSYT